MSPTDHLSQAAEHLRAVRNQPVEDVAAALGQVHEIVRVAQAMALDLSASPEAEHSARQHGAASTQSLIAQSAGVSGRDAARQVNLGRELASKAPQTRAAMDRPGMSPDKARIITRALTELPAKVDADGRAQVEKDLVERAQRHSVEDLRRAAKRAVEVLNRQWADQLENTELGDEEAHAQRASEFWMSRPGDDGMVTGRFTLPVLEADILRSALESHTSPRHDCGHQPELGADESLLDEKPTYPQKLGHAFTDILRHLPTDAYGNHGGVAATLMVTVDHDTLRGAVERSGTDSHGNRVPAATLRQLACAAGILPAVLDGQGQALDVGRQKRLFTTAQRIALAHRDGGCAFPGCDRPPGWTEAHHLRPWAGGGTTDLADGVLLCARHHRLVHHSDWEARPGADGHPEFVPPAHVDPHRRPRQNDRWRPRVA